jgi:hypothetical protein
VTHPHWAAVLSPALGKKLVAALGLEQGPELGEALGMVLGERNRKGARFTTGIGASRGDAGSSTRLCTRASIRAGAGRSAGVALGSSLGEALGVSLGKALGPRRTTRNSTGRITRLGDALGTYFLEERNTVVLAMKDVKCDHHREKE